MPKIPQGTTQIANLPTVSPEKVGAPWGAVGQAGERIEGLGEYGANIYAAQVERERVQAEKDQKAEEANIGGKVKIGLENDKDILLETWRQNPDYQNSETDVDEWEENIRKKYESMSILKSGGESKELRQGIDLSISHAANGLKKVARDRYREGITTETKANWMTQMDFYVRDYANAATPEEKAIVRNNMEAEARELGDRLILWPEEVQKDISGFDKKLQEIYKVMADQVIMVNPREAVFKLLDKEYLPEFKGEGRQGKLEKAIAADKVFRHEEEQKLEKKVKAQSDETYAKFNQRIREGKENIAIIESDIYAQGPAGTKVLSQADYDKALSHVDAVKKSKGIESDPETLQDVTIRSNLSVPQISESEITSLMKSGKLSAEHGGKALDQVRTTNRSLKDEAKTKNNKKYDDAEKYILRGLGVVGGLIGSLTEKIDPMQNELIAQSTAELWNRSIDRGGKEDPMAVAKEILPAYRGAWASKLQQSISTLQKVINIGKYPDKTSVVNAFESGKMTGNEFTRRSQAFMDMENQMRQLEAIQSEVKPKQEKLR